MTKVSAAVMAGGKSTRMGHDKAWLDLGDGRAIVRRVIDALAQVADEVFVVANDERYRSLGLRVIPDRFPDGGPLGGIATGLAESRHDRVIVAACDMPFLRPEVFRLLIERSDRYDVVIPRVGRELETMHALYAKACLPTIERRLRSGSLRVASFLDDVRVLEVREDDLRVVDPELVSFTNVNTPEELESALSRVRCGPVETRSVSWREIEHLIARLLPRIQGIEYDHILVITRGGMVPACMISERTEIRNILCAAVVFYEGTSIARSAPLFVQFPSDDQVSGKRILVVDDVWDTGSTIVAVRDRLRKAGSIVDCCVLHYKPTHSRFPNEAPEFYGEEVSGWIVYPWDASRALPLKLLEDEIA